MDATPAAAGRPLVWALFLVYIVGTAYLGWRGYRKTRDDIGSFAIGDGDLSPLVVGLTLAASIASAATFVINPGFVYVHGLAAFMHLGVSVWLGIGTALVIMSGGFRRHGERTRAVTLPQWIGQRYGSTGLSVLFAAVNLLSVAFVVLIVGGLSIVMQEALGLSNTAALLLTIGFVFSYIFIGGTYAHAYTNTLQAAIMIGVTLVVLGSGLGLFSHGLGAFFDHVAGQDPNLVALVNPNSPLYGSVFSVYVAGFVIGFALACQPHILTKALYVRSDRAVRRYLTVALSVFGLFSLLLLVGLYARVADIPADAFVDPATGAFRQDLVMTVYITRTFGPFLNAVITVALIAAGMSTLDGILVSLSSIAANDLVRNLAGRRLLGGRGEAEQSRIVHRASQVILILIGVLAFLLAWHPPKLLGIFGQVGVYGIAAASTVPILFGILFRRAGRATAWAGGLTGLVVHFALYGLGAWAVAAGVDLTAKAAGWGPLALLFDTSAVQLGLRNPGVTATYALFASALVALAAMAAFDRAAAADAEAPAAAAVD